MSDPGGGAHPGGPGRDAAALPASTRVVAVVLMVGGALYGVLAVLGLSADDRGGALAAAGILVLGLVCILVGARLRSGHRWAYLAAIALLALAAIGGVVNAVRTGDRASLAQLFLPGLGLWLLLREEPRRHFELGRTKHDGS